jgi:FkbM family methyltransferase
MNSPNSMCHAFNLEPLVESALQGSAVTLPTAVRFLEDNRVAKYAMGRNEDTLALHKVLPLDGFIDDYCADEHWHGIPVIKSSQAAAGSMVVNGSTSIAPVNVQTALSKWTHLHAVELHQVIAACGGELQWPRFVRQQRDEISQHFGQWQVLYEQLEDGASKKTLLDTLLFRLTADPKYMRKYRVRIDEQYFEPFMNYTSEVFVDAGGYDGDTTEIFAERYPDYRKIIFFEPSALNMAAARKRLGGLRDIDYRCIGLSDAAGTLSFDAGLGSASAVQTGAGGVVEVDTLDHAVSKPVSFIKMDLEGWEMKALAGAKQHIAQDRPKLALAVYHQAADFRLTNQYLNSFDHGYKVYLRHYTQGWSETVMFFC